jgi:predicted RNA-binding Zn-ribbon protein involved in translation (DUF1610 family)
MVLATAESLARFGLNPAENISSRNNFKQQLESYALHVIEDKPVSNSYSYFIDNGEIYIDRDRNTPLHVDFEERGGLAALGTRKAVALAQAFPGNIVYFYSPPGPVAFETGTKYDLLKPYPDGQLYLLTGGENNQVDSIAISVSKDSEKQTLETFLGKANPPGGFNTEVEKIKFYLTNPIVSDFDIDSLLRHLDHANNFPVYRNVHNEEFFLYDIVGYLAQGWSKKIAPELELDYEELYELAKIRDMRSAYLQQFKNYFPIYGQAGKMVLGGGCGGAIVSESELSSFDPMKGIEQTNPLSTDYRLQTTSIKEIMKNNKENRHSDYDCPKCGHKRQGEIVGSKREDWTPCPNCGNKYVC